MDIKPHSKIQEIIDAKKREDSADEPREALKTAREAIPTPMLDVNLASGDILSFPYAYMTEVGFTPGDTLTLSFGDTKVIIDGRNLREMRERIRLHKADAIQAGSDAEDDVKRDGEAHVNRIDIERGEEKRKEKPNETGRDKGIQR